GLASAARFVAIIAATSMCRMYRCVPAEIANTPASRMTPGRTRSTCAATKYPVPARNPAAIIPSGTQFHPFRSSSESPPRSPSRNSAAAVTTLAAAPARITNRFFTIRSIASSWISRVQARHAAVTGKNSPANSLATFPFRVTLPETRRAGSNARPAAFVSSGPLSPRDTLPPKRITLMTLSDFLGKQFLANIQWNEPEPGILAWRYPMLDQEIQTGAQLTVRESEMAAFVDQGKFADVFGPGLYRLSTQNLPILTDLKNWARDFQSPFKSDVYFFSTHLQIDQKW